MTGLLGTKFQHRATALPRRPDQRRGGVRRDRHVLSRVHAPHGHTHPTGSGVSIVTSGFGMRLLARGRTSRRNPAKGDVVTGLRLAGSIGTGAAPTSAAADAHGSTREALDGKVAVRSGWSTSLMSSAGESKDLRLRAGRADDATACGRFATRRSRQLPTLHNFTPDFPSVDVAIRLI